MSAARAVRRRAARPQLAEARHAAARTSVGGAAAGSSATAGAATLPGSDAGLPPVCNDICTDIDCPSGQTLQYLDTLCCPFCESCSAPDQACPPPDDCGPAAHLEIPAGQCCAQCVANDQVACMNQIQTAQAGANAALQKYSMQCQVDSDCAGAVLATTCTNTCIYAPRASLAAYLADLMQLEDCSACALPPPVASTCVTPVCSSQICSGGIPLLK